MDSLLTTSLGAALEEMQFWLKIMGDHTKLMRGSFDLSEEKYIHDASTFVDVFETLNYKAQHLSSQDEQGIRILLHESMCYTSYLRDFKAQLFQLVSNCKVISKLPAGVYNHVKEEANYFLSVLCRIAGCPLPSKKELGIEESNAPNMVVARKLIPFYNNTILEIAHDINIFWLDKHKEHGDVLLLIAFRPHIQEDFWQKTQSFAKMISDLEDEFKNLQMNNTSVYNFNKKVIPVMENWKAYLEELYRRVFSCNLPSKGINADGSLLDHMAREAGYYLEDLVLLNEGLI